MLGATGTEQQPHSNKRTSGEGLVCGHYGESGVGARRYEERKSGVVLHWKKRKN